MEDLQKKIDACKKHLLNSRGKEIADSTEFIIAPLKGDDGLTLFTWNKKGTKASSSVIKVSPRVATSEYVCWSALVILHELGHAQQGKDGPVHLGEEHLPSFGKGLRAVALRDQGTLFNLALAEQGTVPQCYDRVRCKICPRHPGRPYKAQGGRLEKGW